jgi:fused signal recognition particle receptor
MLLGAALAQVLLVVAVLVVAAIVVAFLVQRSVAKKLPPPGQPTLPTEKPALPKIEIAPVAPPAERVAREQKARDEVEAFEKSLQTARDLLAKDPQSAAAKAEVQRYERDLGDARRKLEYEQRKTEEAQQKAQKLAEAAALEEAIARQKAEEAALAEARKRAEAEARQKAAEAESGRTLAEGLARTRGGFMARLNTLFGTGKALDEASLGELEEILFSADVGVHTATALLENVRERLKRKELADLSKVKSALREEIERILSSTAGAHGGLPDLKDGQQPPQVVMVVGVNGTGKTTTIGKLAAKYQQAGRRTLLGAGDTFRAAAGEQLDVWAERAGVPIVRGKDGADPGSVLFDAVAKGKNEKFDLVLCDTAGRLHTKANLMDELKRVKRTLEKAHPGAPHEVLLVVDATTGQNAIAQARQFHDSLGVTGFVLTKLDGTAKGGVIIGICDELKIPVRYVGIGEKASDLKPFDPHEFVAALFAD